MSIFKVGESVLHCNYLFAKPMLDKARSMQINLMMQSQTKDFTASFVSFICEEIIHDWDNIKDPDGRELDFDKEMLYDIFEMHPEAFVNLVDHVSRVDNFKVVNLNG